jgi:hypothetical protein
MRKGFKKTVKFLNSEVRNRSRTSTVHLEGQASQPGQASQAQPARPASPARPARHSQPGQPFAAKVTLFCLVLRGVAGGGNLAREDLERRGFVFWRFGSLLV